MGVSTNGQICYGIVLDEDVELPWDSVEFDGDIEDWWKDVNGFVNPHENPFDENGEYKAGFSSDDPRISEYYDARREWLKANPLPVELVNYCSGEYPMYILAIPETFDNNHRGYPFKITGKQMNNNADYDSVLQEFCAKYELPYNQPEWWLSSYWG